MEIPSEIKNLLITIEPKLESAFLEGVTSSGEFLPKLPEYDKIPEKLRPQGRKGILLTFAALLASVSNYQGVSGSVPTQHPFQSGSATYTKNFLGEMVLRGNIAVPIATTGTVTISVAYH